MQPGKEFPLTRSHVIALAVIAAIVGLLYARLSSAWFCGYDDFNEIHRAIVDSHDPVRIVSTTHFVGYMYRPVTSLVQYATWNLFDHSAAAFRVRNLAMHVVCACFLYGIVWFSLRSRSIAFGAALLFGVEPLANESVAVAIWTNTTAYAFALAALFFFMWSMDRMQGGKPWFRQIAASLICFPLAIFAYEPAIVVIASIVLYAFLAGVRRKPQRPFVTFASVGFALELAAFFIVRHLVLTRGEAINSADIVLRNTAMYVAALVTPIDFVWSHALAGTPLPQDIHASRAGLLLAAGATAVALALIVRTAYRRARSQPSDSAPRAAIFLAAGIPLGVLPLVLFRSHPSEHDLYLSAAFYTALLCLLARRLLRGRAAYAAVVVAFALSFSAADVYRNGRVIACADVARSIVTQLPIDRWRHGEWNIRLARLPGDPPIRPYGIYYDDNGLAALEIPGRPTPGAQEALQIASGNPHLRARVVGADSLESRCGTPYSCFWVSRTGQVIAATPSVGKR